MSMLPMLSKQARSLLSVNSFGTRLKRKSTARLPAVLSAGLAELTLVNRLRARTRRDLAIDALERAAKIVEVTAKHWFGPQLVLSRGV